MRQIAILGALLLTALPSPAQTPDSSPGIRYTQDGDAYYDDAPTSEEGCTKFVPVVITQPDSKDRNSGTNDEVGKINLIFTAAVAVFTFLLWYSGKKHSERQLRAYVLVEKGGLGNFIAGEVPYAKVRFRNSGQTPASQISVMITIDLCDLPRPNFKPFSGDETKRSRGPIGPKTKFTIPATLKRPIDAYERAQVTCGDKAIYVFGRVDYVDIFKRKQWTTFRYIVRGRGYDLGDSPDLTVAAEGNDAT